MKRAFFVVGPESSGTRLVTRLLMAAECFGDGEDDQRLDSQDFNSAPAQIVFRRSLPHGREWPNVAGYIKRLQVAGIQ